MSSNKPPKYILIVFGGNVETVLYPYKNVNVKLVRDDILTVCSSSAPLWLEAYCVKDLLDKLGYANPLLPLIRAKYVELVD